MVQWLRLCTSGTLSLVRELRFCMQLGQTTTTKSATGNSAQCYVAAWMGGEAGGEWIHVYVWLKLRCSPETITSLIVNWPYPNTKEKVLKKTFLMRLVVLFMNIIIKKYSVLKYVNIWKICLT